MRAQSFFTLTHISHAHIQASRLSRRTTTMLRYYNLSLQGYVWLSTLPPDHYYSSCLISRFWDISNVKYPPGLWHLVICVNRTTQVPLNIRSTYNWEIPIYWSTDFDWFAFFWYLSVEKNTLFTYSYSINISFEQIIAHCHTFETTNANKIMKKKRIKCLFKRFYFSAPANVNYIHQMFRELNKMPAKESKSAYGNRPANTKEPQRDDFNEFAPQKRLFERKPYRNFNVFRFCHKSTVDT